jgi:hypothetical protein
MALSMSLDEPELLAPCAMRVVITIRWELQSACGELVKQSIARAFSNNDPPATIAALKHQVVLSKLERRYTRKDDKKILLVPGR